MKKLALIVSNNLWSCPYVKIYSKLLDGWGIDYDIISWDREGREEEGIQYTNIEKSRNPLCVFMSFVRFSAFVKRTVRKNNYSELIVFDSQLGIFLASFLKKYYQGNYVFDYRDLSIEQKTLFKKSFSTLLKNSYLNVISSPGFKKYLPQFDYTLCHNIDIIKAQKGLMPVAPPDYKQGIIVLTIGAIRKDSNIEVIDSLGDREGFTLSFVGKGPFSSILESYVKDKGYKNIVFKGFYKKEEEEPIIRESTMINIAYPLIPSHISALSNRFYNSLIYRRPMIVTKGTIQGEYAEEYKVGLSLDDYKNLSNDICNYLKSLDDSEYDTNCKKLLSTIIEENKMFEQKLKSFVVKEQ